MIGFNSKTTPTWPRRKFSKKEGKMDLEALRGFSGWYILSYLKPDFNHGFSTSMAFQASLYLLKRPGCIFTTRKVKHFKKLEWPRARRKQEEKEIWKMKQVLFPDSWKTLPFSKLCAKLLCKEKGCTYCSMYDLFNIHGTEWKKGGEEKALKALTARIFITNNIT